MAEHALDAVVEEGRLRNIGSDINETRMDARPVEVKAARALTLIDLLRRDFDEMKVLRERDDSLCNRRAMIRTAVAFLEGAVHVIKDLILSPEWQEKVNCYSRAELALLSNQQFDIDDKGNARIRPQYFQLHKSLAFVLNMLCRSTDAPAAIDRSGEGYRAFRALIQLRNRITHPKTIEDLDVAEEDCALVEKAFGWAALTIVTNLLLAAVGALDRWVEELVSIGTCSNAEDARKFVEHALMTAAMQKSNDRPNAHHTDITP